MLIVKWSSFAYISLLTSLSTYLCASVLALFPGPSLLTSVSTEGLTKVLCTLTYSSFWIWGICRHLNDSLDRESVYFTALTSYPQGVSRGQGHAGIYASCKFNIVGEIFVLSVVVPFCTLNLYSASQEIQN